MQMAVVYSVIVVAGAPLIGIWRAHSWAKKNGLALRKPVAEPERQAA